MKTEPKRTAKPDYQDLQDELERRYGPSLAQEIVDQIRKVEAPEFVPGYMAVKAASEVLELFREEAKAALRKVRECRIAGTAANDKRVVNLKDARSWHELERLLDLYFQAQRGFYRLYKKAMTVYVEESPSNKHRRIPPEPETSLAENVA